MPKSKNRRKKPSKQQAESSSTEVAMQAAAAGTSDGEGGPSASKQERSEKTKNSTGPVEFFQQVRDEGRKVTWTSRNETFVSTIMVLVMVFLACIFFFAADSVLRFVVGQILNLSF